MSTAIEVVLFACAAVLGGWLAARFDQRMKARGVTVDRAAFQMKKAVVGAVALVGVTAAARMLALAVHAA
jgi:hypothetical protein